MIHEAAWPQGTPAWVDLTVTDRKAAMAFYGPLLGWDFDEGGPDTGFYTMATRHGHVVAGIGEPMGPGDDAPPAAWTTYLATDDVDETVETAAAAGATVVVAPMAVMEFGRMALLVDPAGAVVGLWESGTHTGSDLVNEPGGLIWNEGLSHDLPAARLFYGTVFGYTFEDLSAPDFEYAGVNIDGKMVTGLGGNGSMADDAPPHWRAYFAVRDTDVATARAVELGGTVLDPPHDSPYGRLAVVAGPAGELFVLMSTDEPESSEPTSST